MAPNGEPGVATSICHWHHKRVTVASRLEEATIAHGYWPVARVHLALRAVAVVATACVAGRTMRMCRVTPNATASRERFAARAPIG
jgi:hypothetical protein